MTKPPPPIALAEALEHLAQQLRTHGDHATHQAQLLAARGWPTGSDGPTPTTTPLTPLEAAALHPHGYTNIDHDLAKAMHHTWTGTHLTTTLLTRILAHADPTSAGRTIRHTGTGPCLACGRDVPGTAVDRLRGGWCDACRKAWDRAGRPPDRPAWARLRWTDTHPSGASGVVTRSDR